MTPQLRQVPNIDYEAHPAFAGFAAASDAVNAEAEALIADIDAAYNAAQDAENPQDAFDYMVAPHIAALARLAENQAVPQVFTLFLARALGLARDTMRKDLAARASAFSNSAVQELPETLREGLEKFRRDGFFQTSEPKLAHQIWRGIWIERAILRARAARNPKRHTALALHPDSPPMRTIRRCARESGLESFISAYLGKPVTLYYASLDYAHPGQTWFKDCYAGDGMSDSKTVYMHFDADTDIIKAMLYLSDVAEKDGPFSFVRGSHHWKRSPFQLAIRKGFDEASSATFPKTRDQLDFLHGYYRPRFQLAEYRAGMLALPRALRGSTHFGDDVLDGSALSVALLCDEHRFVAPAGTLVVFDGSRGIHRGSLTAAGGARWALQLAFKVRDDAASGSHSTARALRGRLSYLKHTAFNLLRLITGKA